MWWSVGSRTRLVGRERELTAVRRLLRRHRLVTLVGPGGAGKSRLAAELSLGDAVVELEPVRRPDLLWHVIAFALNVWEEPGSPLRATVKHALSDHRVLVLDNCEHLIHEAAAAVAELLAGCPRLRILVTSREPLDLAGEMCVEVGPLTPADARQLFVECGGAPELADSVHDHLPLAIELAAARTDVPARHRTLDAVIRWSYDLLSPAEQSALRRLSALIGDFDLNLAEAVCGDADAVRLMASLRAKSLVVRSPSSSGARFRMLESIRLFGLARLEESREADTTFDVLADALAESIRAIAASPVVTSEMGAWLASQEHQLLQAIARVPRTDPRHTWLVAGVVHAWSLHGSYSEAMRMASDALSQGPLTSHAEFLLFRAAWIAGATGDEVAALRFAEALVAHPAMSTPAWAARGWNTLGYARGINSDLAGARAANERSLAAARSLGDPALLMTFLNNHAWLLMRLNDLPGALAATLESLSFGIRDGFRLMASRHTAGVIALVSNDVDQAEHHFAIALRAGGSTAASLAGVLEGLGVVAARRGDAERAVVLMTAASATRRTRGSRRQEPWNSMVADARELALTSAGPKLASRAKSLGERLDHAGLLAYACTARRDEPLTARQRQIADLVAEGLTNPEIAARLGISVTTVRTHITQMLARLGLSSRTQLAARTARAAR